jgi:hypothetical protein
MALLIFSDKCQFSFEILNFVKSNPSLGQMLRYHNVTTHGRPANPNVTRVPTLVTTEGQIMVGGEVRNWLESMIPVEVETWSGRGGPLTASLDGEDGGPELFSLDSYGQSMQPMLTPELKEKIGKSVTDAYQQNQGTT